MDIKTFITNYYEAFSTRAELPIAFWYSDLLSGELQATQGCLFKALPSIRGGKVISMNAKTIGCGGGKFYTGFTPMPEYVPTFVSQKERYKQTPQQVLEYVQAMKIARTPHIYIHFARIDRLESFDGVEGLLFLATPDVLSGLCTWTFFDNNSPEAVSTLFGSGCSAAITSAINENRAGGRRTFLGFFDPSVRPYVASDVLSFSIPMSRLREMGETMRESCLFDTPAWNKVKARIEGR